MRNTLNASVNTVNMRMSMVEQRRTASPTPKVYPEPPFYSHIYFLGDTWETRRFCSVVQDTFALMGFYLFSDRFGASWQTLSLLYLVARFINKECSCAGASSSKGVVSG